MEGSARFVFNTTLGIAGLFGGRRAVLDADRHDNLLISVRREKAPFPGGGEPRPATIGMPQTGLCRTDSPGRNPRVSSGFQN